MIELSIIVSLGALAVTISLFAISISLNRIAKVLENMNE